MSDKTNTLPQTQPPTWGETFRVYLEPATLRMLFLGFSAGLPLLLVLGTLSFWLREAGIDRTTIGFLSWVGLAYAFKWAWAPLVEWARWIVSTSPDRPVAPGFKVSHAEAKKLRDELVAPAGKAIAPPSSP